MLMAVASQYEACRQYFPYGKSSRHKKRRYDYSLGQGCVRWCCLPCYLAFRSPTLVRARQHEPGKQAPFTMCILGEGRDHGGAHRNRSRLTVHPILGTCWTTGLSLLYCRGRRPQG